jgi:inner membrane protein
MSRALLWKFLSTSLVALLLLVPLALIKSKIDEREMRRRAVESELAATGVGSQRVAGPILVVPCTEHYLEEVTDAKGNKQKEKRRRDCTLRFTPTDLKASGALDTETRTRGIYSMLFYGTSLDVSGQFDVALPESTTAEGGVRQFGAAQLRIGIEDVRGIRDWVKVRWDDAEFAFAPGSKDAALGSGIHAVLGGALAQVAGRHRFSFRLDLKGTKSLEFVPLAKQTQIDLQGQWPHPSFYGRFLPEKREVSERGFRATWKISELAASAPQAILTCEGEKCAGLQHEAYGVALIEPVDVYLQSARAVNYGFLFVGLTFVLFLLFEVMKSLRVHAVQYALVGLALAVFFLLLFSLAEHVAFLHAYLIAAGACIALITFYVSHILHSAKRGLLFSVYLVGLYIALYMLLRSEDYAMVLGAILVFSVLAITMILTRRMDWFSVGEQLGGARARPSGLPTGALS